MRVAFYGRVSTIKQDTDLQRDALRLAAKARGWVVVAEHFEIITGRHADRPHLKLVMEAAARRTIGAVVVTKLDRFARSLKDLLVLVDTLAQNNVQFICTDQPIDTTTPVGRLFLQVLGAVAEFERSLIIERTRAGRQRAEEEGKVTHRPRKVLDEKRLRELVARGWSDSLLAEAFGVSRWLIASRVKEMGLRQKERDEHGHTEIK